MDNLSLFTSLLKMLAALAIVLGVLIGSLFLFRKLLTALRCRQARRR